MGNDKEQGRGAIISAYKRMTVYSLDNIANLNLEILKTIKSEEEKKQYLLDLKEAMKSSSTDYAIASKKIEDELAKMTSPAGGGKERRSIWRALYEIWKTDNK